MKLTDSRRWTGRFLTALAILVLVFSSGWNQSALAETRRQECHGFLLDKSNSTDSNRDWVEPPVLQAMPGNSFFTVNLTADQVAKTVDPLFERCLLYSYKFSCEDNCQLIDPDWDEKIPVGPTIKVKPGQTLNVNLQNNLMDPTNLHTHGLHISPKETSDNVLLEIYNDQSYDYNFEIPSNHYPGTFWYHPHVHRTTATQVEDGMAGALIVEDPTDEDNPYPDWVNPDWVKAAEDRIFVFQQIPFSHKYAEENSDKSFKVTINGVLSPIMKMDLGALERWRFIHAGEDESIVLNFSSLIARGFRFKLIALDGITLEHSRDIDDSYDELELYPGYRADVIVEAPTTESQLQGKSSLTNNRQKVVRLFGKAKAHFPSLSQGDEDLVTALSQGDEDLVTVELTSELSLLEDIEDIDIHIPDHNNDLLRPPALELLHDIDEEKEQMANTKDNPREVTFNINTENKDNPLFTINGKEYPDDQDQKFCLKRGEAEYWKLTSDAYDHPFHIHVNAFQVVDAGASGTTKGDWHDTIIVKAHTPAVIIKTRYDDFDGKFVLHCHILHHEDEGMMSLVEINDLGADSCNTPPPALAKIDK